jgi:hypothetical protein
MSSSAAARRPIWVGGATTGEDIMSITQLQTISSVGAGSSRHLRPSQSPSPARPCPPLVPDRPTVELAFSRAAAANPNHHLWKNGRLWWIAFTLLHDGWRQERVRQSLGTDNLLEARRRRDAILSLFGSNDGDGCLDPEPEGVAN